MARKPHILLTGCRNHIILRGNGGQGPMQRTNRYFSSAMVGIDALEGTNSRTLMKSMPTTHG